MMMIKIGNNFGSTGGPTGSGGGEVWRLRGVGEAALEEVKRQGQVHHHNNDDNKLHHQANKPLSYPF